jgi:hypothetical protein
MQETTDFSEVGYPLYFAERQPPGWLCTQGIAHQGLNTLLLVLSVWV